MTSSHFLPFVENFCQGRHLLYLPFCQGDNCSFNNSKLYVNIFSYLVNTYMQYTFPKSHITYSSLIHTQNFFTVPKYVRICWFSYSVKIQQFFCLQFHFVCMYWFFAWLVYCVQIQYYTYIIDNMSYAFYSNMTTYNNTFNFTLYST